MIFNFFHGRPLLLGIVLAIGSVLGIIGYNNMPRNMYPDVERPQVTVVTVLPGASAQSVAQKVSRPIEQELYALSGVRDVQSTNKNEVSIVRAEFEYEKGLDPALLDVNNALSKVRGKLPPEAQPPSVYAVGSFTQPVMVLSLAPKAGSGLDLAQVRLLAENDIRAAMLTQPNIANVEVFGGYEPALRIDFDPLQLARYRISQAQLQEAIHNLDRDLPLGSVKQKDGSLTLTSYGERAEAAQLRRLPIADGISLGDVAKVSLSYAERYAAYHGNGTPAIAMSILRAPGGAVQSAIHDAEAQLPALKARYPQIEFSITDTQGELIELSNGNMIVALRDAIIFVSLVILFFLANWRAVVTSLITIPLVFFLTLAVLWFMGKELNMLVMTGIILALGMLVDDAVVVLENIERHLEELHEDPLVAIRKGTEEVLFPVFLGTIATVVVIAPLMFVGDYPEQVFSHLALPVIIAVFVSYFLAITFIPRISVLWYRNGLPPKNALERRLEHWYQRLVAPGAGLYAGLLRFALRGGHLRRLLFILPGILLLVVSFKLVLPLVGRDALPPMDTGQVRAHIKFGANEPVEVAEARLRDFQKQLMADKRVERVSASFGSEPGVLSLGSGQLPAEANIMITYVDRMSREQSSWGIEADLRRRLASLPGVTAVDVFDAAATPLSTIKSPVNIRLLAEDWRLLPEAAQKAQAALLRVPGFTSVSTSWDRDSAEAELVLDENRLHELGLTPEAVASQLPLKGQAVASLSKLPTVSALPVRSYFSAPYRSDPGAIRLLPIRTPDGGSVSLGEIAELVYHPTTALLSTNRLRYSLDLFAYREGAPISHLSAGAQKAVRKVLPPGVEMRDEGDAASAADSSKRMLTGLGLGIMLLFGILVPSYGSIGLAVLSILILPLSVIGAIWGLLVFDKALALPAILGIVLLFSIIIKNSILMVDFIQERRRAGDSAAEAAEGSVRLRYRPILMTALATIAGMIPIALEHAVGMERLSPLADATIGGLVVGTLLSLFYLPMLYVWVMDKGKVEAG